ncbi:trypsin-like serine peptidase [Streptomyces sp. NPDC018019]|uniref:trypsin-like serine peptidase n=1 Tax=Streptomyces sp. NPDC018019 TaxID=3365030 RepID=UPI00379BF93E
MNRTGARRSAGDGRSGTADAGGRPGPADGDGRPDGRPRHRRRGHRRRRPALVRTAAAGAGLALCLLVAPASGATADDDDDGGGWTSEAATQYWTAGRMASAVPAGPGAGKSAAAPAARTTAAGQGAAGAPAAGSAQHFDGVPSVGVLFSVDKDAQAHHCTASVVRSPRRNLILTAGHCDPGSRAAFVPQYRSGAETQPYGVWAIDRGFTDPRRTGTGPGSDLDFAFATVKPDGQGRALESVTGGNILSRTPGYTTDVTVIGYPTARNDPADRAIRCAVRTSRLTGQRQLRMECGGFYGGTSGSPWLSRFDERTKTGYVVGNIGGLNGGGPSGPDSHRTSYSPYYGADVFRLYARAVTG